MIKLYTITIIIIMIKLGATDKLKIEPLGIMHKFGQRARPQGSASFTGWTEGMSKFGQNYFTKQGSLLLEDELNICRGYYECDARNRDQAVDGVEGALCRQNDGVGSARLRLTVHTANTDTQNTKYWQQKNANTLANTKKEYANFDLYTKF